jgi:hypothetical protein
MNGIQSLSPRSDPGPRPHSHSRCCNAPCSVRARNASSDSSPIDNPGLPDQMSAVERSVVRAREMGVLASSDATHPRARPTGGVCAGGGWLWSLDSATPLVSILPTRRAVSRLPVRPPTHIRVVAMRLVWCRCGDRRPVLVLGRKPHKRPTGGVGADGGWGWFLDRTTHDSSQPMLPDGPMQPREVFSEAYLRDLAMHLVRCRCRRRLASHLVGDIATAVGGPPKASCRHSSVASVAELLTALWIIPSCRISRVVEPVRWFARRGWMANLVNR